MRQEVMGRKGSDQAGQGQPSFMLCSKITPSSSPWKTLPTALGESLMFYCLQFCEIMVFPCLSALPGCLGCTSLFRLLLPTSLHQAALTLLPHPMGCSS